MKYIITVLLLLCSCTATHAQFELIQCEDTCHHIHGIDLSHYQGQVFWAAIGENAKMAYVYLKATEGGDRIDARYKENIDMAHMQGLKVGSYHFFRPTTELKKQLKNFTDQCKAEQQELIPMIDVETAGRLPVSEFCDSLLTFLKLVEEAYGQKPLVYTGTNFYNKYLVGKLDEYQLMIAQYSSLPPVLADRRDYMFWQYTAKGRINGINGFVDKSRTTGIHSIKEIFFKKRLPKPVVTETRHQTVIEVDEE